MTKNSHYQQLEALFESLRPDLLSILSHDELAEVMEFVDHNEFGIALESLCFILEDGKKPITKKIYDRIDQLGILMEMDKDTWKNLQALIGK